MKSGLYDALADAELVVRHQVVHCDPSASGRGLFAVIEPERVRFISCLYEWYQLPTALRSLLTVLDAEDVAASLHVSKSIASNYGTDVGYMWNRDGAGAEPHLRRALALAGEPGADVHWLTCATNLALGQALWLQANVQESSAALGVVLRTCDDRPADVLVAKETLDQIHSTEPIKRTTDVREN